MSQFATLKVNDIRKETADTVSIAFEIPSTLKEQFKYQSGQYVTIKQLIDGEEVRRAYSLCSSPDEDDYRIAVKRVEGGKMSTYLNQSLQAGDQLEVMPPMGNFCVPDSNNGGKFIGFAAGSGITPIISIVKNVLRTTSGTFSLYYGNKTTDSTIFKQQLDNLKAEYNDRFQLHYIFSQEKDAVNRGRLDTDNVNAFIRKDLEMLKSDGIYICGPEQMIHDVSEAFKYLGVDEKKIHFELFTAPTKSNESEVEATNDFVGESEVTVIMDGDEFEFSLKCDGAFILDAAMEQGADAPFSCKGAVCCTCKAQVVEGKAVMDMNYALSDEEVADGFILTCQARPASERVVIDYDVI